METANETIGTLRQLAESTNFLHYHCKKGVESFQGGIESISIRSHTAENVAKISKKPILVTAENKEGYMLLTPDNIYEKVHFETDKIYGERGKKYSLLKIKWQPESLYLLLRIDFYLTQIKESHQRINELLKEYDKDRY